MDKEIIAVFGGAFNPPTVAHINFAKQILNKIDRVEKVIFVPVSTKYHKSGLASDADRYNMLKCICDSEECLEVSSIELDSTRQLYTIETLRILKKRYPDKEIYFIIGTDNLKEIKAWYKADLLLQEFKIIVLERNEDIMENIIENDNFLKQYESSFIKLQHIEKMHISSTYIRKQIELGNPVDTLVPNQLIEKIDILKNIYQKAT